MMSFIMFIFFSIYYLSFGRWKWVVKFVCPLDMYSLVMYSRLQCAFIKCIPAYYYYYYYYCYTTYVGWCILFYEPLNCGVEFDMFTHLGGRLARCQCDDNEKCVREREAFRIVIDIVDRLFRPRRRVSLGRFRVGRSGLVSSS